MQRLNYSAAWPQAAQAASKPAAAASPAGMLGTASPEGSVCQIACGRH